MSIGALDKISPLEFLWLLESHYEQEREELELLNHTIKTAISSVHSRKNLKLFEDKRGSQSDKKFNSKEEKLKELEELKNNF